MICGTCKQEKPLIEFTRLNRSADGKRGLCTDCKSIRDAKYRAKKDMQESKLADFPLVPDLLIRVENKARIGVLILNNIINRKNTKQEMFFQLPNQGLKAVLDELAEPYEFCLPEHLNNYNYILISLTSVMDVENLIYTFEKYAPQEIKPVVIVGGFGVCNIKLIVPYIDVAVFGRAEGQINDIIEGKSFDNVWRKPEDPTVEGRYSVRQPRYLTAGERNVGCRNKCKYCQYTWTRRQINKVSNYDPGMKVQETDWHGLEVDKPGKYVSAWDGFSEQTRLAVNKHITDADIVNKLLGIDSNRIPGHVTIKVFNIVGYPWETKETVLEGMNGIAKMLAAVDKEIKAKITLPILCTPFGPEPLTPMQYEPANITTNWREMLSGKHVYKGNNINCFVIPSVMGPYALTKRILIHRLEMAGLDLFKAIAFSGRLKRMPERWKVPWLIKNGYVNADTLGKVEGAAFDYLYVEHAHPQGVGKSFGD